jgi:hypothetical protein
VAAWQVVARHFSLVHAPPLAAREARDLGPDSLTGWAPVLASGQRSAQEERGPESAPDSYRPAAHDRVSAQVGRDPAADSPTAWGLASGRPRCQA